MKHFFKVTALSLLLTTPSINSAFAMGGPKSPSNQAPTQPAPGGSLVDLGLSFAIVYAKNDPRYAALLNTLNIHSPADLKAFLLGNEDGSNLQHIIARLVFLKAQSDPKVNEWLVSLGITDEKSLREFIKTAGTSQLDLIYGIAYQHAASNSKYSVWLKQLNIQSAEDLRLLLTKGGTTTNFHSLILVVGLNYVNNNPKYAKYKEYIEVAMVFYGIQVGADGTGDDTTSDDDIINLGSFNGMTVGEVKAIQKIK